MSMDIPPTITFLTASHSADCKVAFEDAIF